MDDYHLKSFHASSKPDGEDAYRSYMDDDDNLVRMGKKPVLKVTIQQVDWIQRHSFW